MRVDALAGLARHSGGNGRVVFAVSRHREDLAFCMRAREAGYKILCDPSITLGHVGNTIITKQFFDAYTAGRSKA